MVRLNVAMRREAQINYAVCERQRRAILVIERIERNLPVNAGLSGSCYRRLNRYRTVRLLKAGCDIKRVKLLLI